MLEFLEEVILEGFLDTLKVLPLLFLTYLLMEFLEHKAGERFRGTMKRAGSFAPAIGGVFGILPQCGFSAATAELYNGGVVGAGTLVAVFLATSDEMLPLLISAALPVRTVVFLLGYKLLVAVAVGVALDQILRVTHKNRSEGAVEILRGDHDDCKPLTSSLFHTLKTGGFLLAINLLLGALIFFIGMDRLTALTAVAPALTYPVAALIGLIPNCAASVALTELWLKGILSAGAMLAGLFPGAGVGLIVFLRGKKSTRQKITVLLLLTAVGILAGILADVTKIFV